MNFRSDKMQNEGMNRKPYPAIEIADTETNAVLARLSVSAPARFEQTAWMDDSTVALSVIDAGYYLLRWQRSRLITFRRACLAAVIGIPALGLVWIYAEAQNRHAVMVAGTRPR